MPFPKATQILSATALSTQNATGVSVKRCFCIFLGLCKESPSFYGLDLSPAIWAADTVLYLEPNFTLKIPHWARTKLGSFCVLYRVCDLQKGLCCKFSRYTLILGYLLGLLIYKSWTWASSSLEGKCSSGLCGIMVGNGKVLELPLVCTTHNSHRELPQQCAGEAVIIKNNKR